MKRICLFVTSILLCTCGFTQNFPFPMNENGYTYPYGIAASSPSNSSIQSKFVAWDRAMYDESGEFGRIKFDEEQYTVSEGIAYGMLIYVYMANETNTKCQERFDKLYAYYKKWSNRNGVMNWKINGYSSVEGNNGATDADLDVAFALCLAAKQWESSDKYVYATEAENLLRIVYNTEVTTKNGYKVFKPGDTWDNFGNPCYFTVASVGVFNQAQDALGFSSTKDWESVYEGTHTWLELTQKNGLWPNWAFWDGSLGVSGYKNADDFGWDACRTPWRVAWDYVWFGNESSKKMMGKTIEMLDAKGWESSPNNVGFLTGLSGSSYASLSIPSDQRYSAGNVAWTGSVGCAFMVDETRQENLDTYYRQNCQKTGGPYYAQTVQVLYMLLLSGNAANFYDCNNSGTVVNPVVTSASTNGTSVVLTSSKALKTSSDYSGFTLYKNGTKVSNALSSINVSGKTITLTLNNVTVEAEDIISISYEGEYLASEEETLLGKSVLYPVKNNVSGGSTLLADCENNNVTLLGGEWYSYGDNGATQSFSIVTGGANSSAHSAQFTYSNVTQYAGMGFSILESESAAYDLSGSTGISFYHKGDATVLEFGTESITDYSYHIYNIDSHSDWTPVELTWDDVALPGWGTGNSMNFAEEKLYSELVKFQWKVSSGAGEFSIDEFTVIGKTISGDEVNKSTLEATLATANSLYGGATTERYPKSAITALYDALVAAGTVDMNTSATQTQADNANTTLLSAIATFKAAEIKVVDKSKLSIVIKSATLLQEESVVGDENGQFPQSAMDALVDAIAVAQSVYDAEDATEDAVETATTELKDAIETFKDAEIFRADKTELKKYIDLATEILATTEAGTAVGQYSETKRSTLETKLNTAKKRYDDTEATQGVVDNALNSLKDSYTLYVNSKIESTAIDEKGLQLAVYPNPCTDIVNVSADKEISHIQFIGLQGTHTSYYIGSSRAQISVAELANGLYSIQVFFADGTQFGTRLIKK